MTKHCPIYFNSGFHEALSDEHNANPWIETYF